MKVYTVSTNSWHPRPHPRSTITYHIKEEEARERFNSILKNIDMDKESVYLQEFDTETEYVDTLEWYFCTQDDPDPEEGTIRDSRLMKTSHLKR